MIKLINESLFKQKTKSCENKDGNGNIFLTTFKSAVKTPNPSLKGGLSARNIVTVMHTEEDNFNKQNTKINSFIGKDSKTTLRISQGDYRDDTTVYFLAIPYSGIMVPIPETKEFRIYRGLTVRAAKRTIEYNDEKFNKIAFVIMTINQNVFDPNYKYYKDHLEFVVETYNLEDDTVNKDVKKTVKTTITVTFYPDKDPVYATKMEEVDPINPKDYMGEKIFPLYVITPDEKKSKDKLKNENTDDASKVETISTKNNEDDSNSFGTPVIPKNTTLEEMLNDVRRVEQDNRRAFDNRGSKKNKKRRR